MMRIRAPGDLSQHVDDMFDKKVSAIPAGRMLSRSWGYMDSLAVQFVRAL